MLDFGFKMPPFGVEQAEVAKNKPLPFLSFKSHDPVKPKKRSGPFGAEPAEETSSKPLKPQPGFLSSGKRCAVSSSSTVLFGNEPAEGDEESGAASDSSSSWSEGAFKGKERTVFSMGWHSMLDMKRSSFWKENVDDKAPKLKRKYDNTGRSAAASYARKTSSGLFKQNGLDPERLERLVGSKSCQCFLVFLFGIHTFQSFGFASPGLLMLCWLLVHIFLCWESNVNSLSIIHAYIDMYIGMYIGMYINTHSRYIVWGFLC